MIPFIITFFGGLLVGAAFGVIGYKVLQEEKVVTVLELTDWAQKLRNAASTDAQAAKGMIRELVTELEKKF
jgi:hypothetical protein